MYKETVRAEIELYSHCPLSKHAKLPDDKSMRLPYINKSMVIASHGLEMFLAVI